LDGVVIKGKQYSIATKSGLTGVSYLHRENE